MTIGERILKLRKLKGISQKWLGIDTGIRREYISKLESGALPNPTYFTIQKLADGLGARPSVLADDHLFAIFIRTVAAQNRASQATELLGAVVEEIGQIPCTKP